MGGLPQAQYSVHSSANPSASGIKYDPLRYGLKPGKYRVKHFGHSTQWRTREAMARVGELLRWKLAACAHPSGTASSSGSAWLSLWCGSFGWPSSTSSTRRRSRSVPSRAIVTAPPNRRDSDTQMGPLSFDVLFPIIHGARFGRDVSGRAPDTTIQRQRPP
jgi:hypothetical protein